jgi:hypothetical protein
MALSAIVQGVNDGCSFVVDVDLKSYFDTISHELLLELVERLVGDVQILRLIRAWLKAGVMEEGKVTHPDQRWGYRFLHDRCRLYQMVGKVSHLEGLRRTPPDEDDRRAGCGKTARPVR